MVARMDERCQLQVLQGEEGGPRPRYDSMKAPHALLRGGNEHPNRLRLRVEEESSRCNQSQ